MTQIPIFYAVNDKYAPGLAVSIESLIKSSDPEKQYRVIVLQEGLTAAHTAALKALATANVQIDLQPMGDRIRECLADNENKLFASYFTLTIYYRLFIPEMFPQYDKGIYLDADTVVLRDVADLYATDVSNSLVAAAVDPFVKTDPVLAPYAAGAVGVPPADYVNSGVLVMNLAAMRDRRFADHFLNLLNTYKFKSIAADQDYLNAIAHDEMVQLSPSWNVQERHPKYDAFLVHYNLFKKPWHYTGVPYEREFWDYAAATPFKKELLDQKRAFTEADIQADNARLDKLVANAKHITTQTGTFRDVNERLGGVRL
ncbi:glycosyltransferase family 8 protein [Lacticaseibacillus pabuli]|uniref:Glycosyltransferase family 8 protein n=1 Tax=Lacticaseibacillus pabuli TaxID=3025672 RepID=A0ABY7WSD1_9LACO|nr:glycosyltransferase family 8 protein [Lacticaseibacillus sp. KACC 23028]WDF82040.1 glycosyltransferase family 8 protein [Lacticaseibacillus sp. KACC 23028]